MIRFVFSTNATNEHTGSVLAGWIIDQVEISTDAIVDVVAPEIEIAPASSVVASVSAPLPFVSASFLDNTGVTSVTMQCTYTTSSGTVSGTDLLTQDPEDISLFSIQTAMAFGAAPEIDLATTLRWPMLFQTRFEYPLG